MVCSQTFVCVCICSSTIRASAVFIEHPSQCEECKHQEREHDHQHLQLREHRCHQCPPGATAVWWQSTVHLLYSKGDFSPAAHTESELKLSSYLRCVTWASRCWPSHSSFMIHDTHTLSHFICPSLSLCHTLARTVKSWLTRAISSLSEIKLTLIINGPCCCVC